MTFEYFIDTLHRVRADELEHDAVAETVVRRVRRARRLELAARLLDHLARRLEARAGTSRARLL